MKVTVTARGFDGLERSLDDAADEIVPEGRKVVGKGSLNIKRDWQRRWSGLDHAGGLPRTISYDIRTRGDVIDGETGPDLARGGQAPLGGFLENEYGTPWSAPRPAGQPALDAEEPRFVAAVEKLGADLLEGR
ncbi:hypothetical protein ACFOOK_28115 [Micromonospora krabiensis]|uniref:Uncharacterized protein n=1 Tax=Micromonospora krabiensis TaxID=307121 RepID=A0A1C3N4S5_9ACTN|nr:hypothetical protein [Micromonospora krabiensis]SBV27565.1 hypothetical protein GA0070620_3089 [Micromonospora krabiensis]